MATGAALASSPAPTTPVAVLPLPPPPPSSTAVSSRRSALPGARYSTTHRSRSSSSAPKSVLYHAPMILDTATVRCAGSPTTRTSPPQNASAAAASCASRPAAVYVRMGGHDRAPHTSAKWMRGSMGSTAWCRRGSFGPKGPRDIPGAPTSAPSDAAPGRFPRSTPCSMSSQEYAWPPMSYVYRPKNDRRSRKPPGGPTAQHTCTTMALYTLMKNAVRSGVVSENTSTAWSSPVASTYAANAGLSRMPS
mmetsp:Transcript_14492/g.23833  ORF Transcript_14492/g.23833 Transcript_14492/m.23833 type:complete len:249 (-) Transcript_14492:433-1179(-)